MDEGSTTMIPSLNSPPPLAAAAAVVVDSEASNAAIAESNLKGSTSKADDMRCVRVFTLEANASFASLRCWLTFNVATAEDDDDDDVLIDFFFCPVLEVAC